MKTLHTLVLTFVSFVLIQAYLPPIGDKNTCEVFVGYDPKGNPYPKCDTCWDWYMEYLQYRIWMPNCGKSDDWKQYYHQLNKYISRRIKNDCLRFKALDSENADCNYYKNKFFESCTSTLSYLPFSENVNPMLSRQNGLEDAEPMADCCYDTCYEYYLALLENNIFIAGCGQVPLPKFHYVTKDHERQDYLISKK